MITPDLSYECGLHLQEAYHMHTIHCSARLHREEERLFIDSPNLKKFNDILRSQPGIKFSKTHKQWHLPLDEKTYRDLVQAIGALAVIEDTALRTYLTDRSAKKSNALIPVKHTAALTPKASVPALQKDKPANLPAVPRLSYSASPATVAANTIASTLLKIAAVNGHVLPNFKQELVLKAYSSSTIRTYMNEMTQYLQALKRHSADGMPVERIRQYLQFCFEVLKLSENTIHSRINALKFYYEQVLKRDRFFWEIPRPKKPQQLPRLLSEVELTRLFNALRNKKHKAMLFTAYSAGLRVSEIVSLRIADIDSSRMQILLTRAKGKKDRYVNLSPVLLDILRQYITSARPRPRIYLFESEATGRAFPTRTVQQIFSQAKHAAGIRKEVGIHSLRHSFATHLLEKGTDIRYIKDILGHFNIRTTERYLHVANRQLVNIISPFDDLWKKNGVDW